MKIADVEVIPFRVPRRLYRNGEVLSEADGVQTLTRIVTDEGAEGYYLGGQGHGDADGLLPEDRAAVGRVRALLVGQDPFDREKFWQCVWGANTNTALRI